MRWRVLHLALVWGLVMTTVQADIPQERSLDHFETGDAGRYTATYVGHWPFDEGVAQESLAFTTATPRDAIRADGSVAPAWPMSVHEIRLDMAASGHLVPSGDVYVRLMGPEPFAEQRSATDYRPLQHCILDAVHLAHEPAPCRLPGLQAVLPAAEAHAAGHTRIAGLVTKQVDMGDATYWFVPDIPVPMRAEFVHDRGTVRFDLAGFHAGAGGLVASSIAAPRLETTPITPWLIEDDGRGFAISDAYEAALTARDWPHLRTWLREHHDAVVALAAFDGGWELQLADGSDSFAFRVDRAQGLLAPTIDLRLMTPTIDAVSAPAEVVTLDSVSRLFARHGGDMRAYGFSLVDGVQIVVAEGPIAWSKDGRQVVADEYLVVDGQGQAIERSGGGEPHIQAPLGLASTGWPMDVAARGWIGWLAAASVLYLLPKLGVGLFSRLAPHQLTQDATRAAIMDAVTAEPGLHLRALADRLGAPVGRVRHHARKLVQGGLLRERTTPGFTCYFADSTDRAVLDAGPITRSDGARKVLAAAEGRVAKDIAAAAGLSPATASYHLKRLREAGLVEAEPQGRMTRFRLTSAGAAARRGLGLA